MVNSKLNKDIDLNHTGYGFWDISVDKNGFVILEDIESLENGIIIAILTRFRELNQLPTYKDFGCRVHELIKAKRTKMNEYKIKTYIEQSVEAMNRVKSVDDVIITPNQLGYNVKVFCTSIDDKRVSAEVNI